MILEVPTLCGVGREEGDRHGHDLPGLACCSLGGFAMPWRRRGITGGQDREARQATRLDILLSGLQTRRYIPRCVGRDRG